MDEKKFLVILRQVQGGIRDQYNGLIEEAETREEAAGKALEQWLINYNQAGYVALVVELESAIGAVFSIQPHYGSVSGYSSHDYSLDHMLMDSSIPSILIPAFGNKKY